MRTFMVLMMAAAVASLCVVGSCFAGANAGAAARIYWQDGTGPGLDSAEASGGTPQLVIVAKGLSLFRGADVRLLIVPCGGGQLPAAWQGNGTGGCNDGYWTFYVGGPGGFYPNAFTVSPAVPNVAISSNQEYYNQPVCGVTSSSVGILWLHAEGSAGVARDPNLDYALWAIKFDLRGVAMGGSVSCAGDLSDPSGPKGVQFFACNGYPCGSPSHPASVALIDGSGAVDYVQALGLYSEVAWRPPLVCVAAPAFDGCLQSDPAEQSTWGKLKSLYK